MNSLSDINDCLVRFESQIHEADVRLFRNTRLQDVYDAAQIVEREQEHGQRMCNLRRIEPLLEALRKLASVAEESLLDKSKISYLWGPIKLLLQIAEEDDDSFKQLLTAYSQLAKHLAFVDRLPALLAASDYFKTIPVDIFEDILEFHAQTYTLLRRGGWPQLFQASWKNFSPQLECILRRLSGYADLDQRLAIAQGKSYGTTSMGNHASLHQGDSYVTNHITHVSPELLHSMHQQWMEARVFRQTVTEDVQKREAERSARQLRDTIAWLRLLDQDQEQESLFSRKADHREDDTCEWLQQNTDFKHWLDLDHRQKYLWLKGKPGSGKTTIATFVLEKTKFPLGSAVLHCLCSQNFDLPASDFCSLVFRMFIGQILRKNPGLVPYVYEEFVRKAEVSALRVLAPLLRTLLFSLPSAFIIVDGLDECGQEAQSIFIKKLDFLLATQKDSNTPSTPELKILISSCDTKTIPTRLRRGPTISLSREAEHISKDIKLYTVRKISELKDRFSEEEVEDIARNIVKKADGMFLWVRLVTDTLLEQQSLQDLQDAVQKLPSDLKGLYQMILERIEHRLDEKQKTYVCNILTLMVYSRQSLKSYELCAAIVFSNPGNKFNKNTKLEKGVLDYCKPLLEEHADDKISFVHFSVKEFLRKGKNTRFVDPATGPKLLAAICIRFLLSCDQFFLRRQSASSSGQIVLGYYVLFPYFYEHWRSHLVDDPEEYQENGVASPSVSKYSKDDLSYKATPDSSAWNARQLLAVEVNSLQRQTAEKKPVNNAHVGILAALNTTNNIQHRLEEEETTNPSTGDPISEAYQRYREQFEALLQPYRRLSTAEMGVSEQDLRTFLDRHAEGAFLCTSHDCPRKANGFRTAEERDRHCQAHFRTLCCPEPDCDLSTFNFANRAALTRHLAKYHEFQSEAPIPRLKLSRPLNLSNLGSSATPRAFGPATASSDRGSQRFATHSAIAFNSTGLVDDQLQVTRKRRWQDGVSINEKPSQTRQAVDEHERQASQSIESSATWSSNPHSTISSWSKAIRVRHASNRVRRPTSQERSCFEDFRTCVRQYISKQVSGISSITPGILHSVNVMDNRFESAIDELDESARNWCSKIPFAVPKNIDYRETIFEYDVDDRLASLHRHIQRLLSSVVLAAALSAWLSKVDEHTMRKYWTQSLGADRSHLRAILKDYAHPTDPESENSAVVAMITFTMDEQRKLSSYVFSKQANTRDTESSTSITEKSPAPVVLSQGRRPLSHAQMESIYDKIKKIPGDLIFKGIEIVNFHRALHESQETIMQRREITLLDRNWIANRALEIYEITPRKILDDNMLAIDPDTKDALHTNSINLLHYVIVKTATQQFRERQKKIISNMMQLYIQAYWDDHGAITAVKLLCVSGAWEYMSPGKCQPMIVYNTFPWLNVGGHVSIFIDPSAFYTQYGPCVRWQISQDDDGYIELLCHSEEDAVKIKNFIEAAQWIEGKINVYLHMFLDQPGDSVNAGNRATLSPIVLDFWAEIVEMSKTLLQKRSLQTYTNAGTGGYGTLIVPHDWSPGEYYMDFEFETEIMKWRTTFIENSAFDVTFLLWTSKPDFAATISLVEAAQLTRQRFEKDMYWLGSDSIEVQLQRYFSRVVQALKSPRSESGESLPFRLDSSMLDRAAEANSHAINGLLYEYDPPAEWTHLILSISARQVGSLNVLEALELLAA